MLCWQVVVGDESIRIYSKLFEMAFWGPRKTVASEVDVVPRNAAMLVQSEARRRKRCLRGRFFEVPYCGRGEKLRSDSPPSQNIGGKKGSDES